MGGLRGETSALSPAKAAGPALPARVMFTADDFGLSPSLNQAAALAHLVGLVGNVSFMAGGPAASQALALARSFPALCLGVHLTLIQGRAVLPPRQLPGLVDSEGRFPDPPVGTGWRYFWQQGLIPAIRRELRAQIEVVLQAGLRVWHLNGHLNLHLHPRLFPLVLALAREYAIPGLRLAAEDWRTTFRLSFPENFPNVVVGVIFTVLCRRARRRAVAAGLVVNDHFFGLTNPGRITEDFLLKLVPRLKPGLTEICLHPALSRDPLLDRTAPGYQRLKELKALISPRLREVLRQQGLHVTNFQEEVAAQTASGIFPLDKPAGLLIHYEHERE